MKIFIVPHTKNNFQVKWCCPRNRKILFEGFEQISEVKLVDNEIDADYIIFCDVPQNHGEKSFELINRLDPKKLIVVDSIDENDQYFLPQLDPSRYFLYFKRSLIKVDQNGNRLRIPCVERQYPWDYALLQGFEQPKQRKTIDVGCYLRNSCNLRYATLINTYNWSQTEKAKNYTYYIGEVSHGSRSLPTGEVYFDPTYFTYLAQTKIIVSSGPYGWTGDSRGAEAVSNRCIYMSNEFFDLMPNPPIDMYHWVKFNPLDYNQLVYYLNNILDWRWEKQRIIMDNGYEHCMKYHTSKARCQYILDKIEENS